MTTPANIIATSLASLPHPDGVPRIMPGFSAQLLPEPLQQQMTQTAQDIGDCIVHLLQSHGYHILTDFELAQAAEQELSTTANIHCTICDAKLFSLNLINPAHCLTNAQHFIEAMHNLSPECPHQ